MIEQIDRSGKVVVSTLEDLLSFTKAARVSGRMNGSALDIIDSSVEYQDTLLDGLYQLFLHCFGVVMQ